MHYSAYLKMLEQKCTSESVIITRHDTCITLGKNAHEREVLESAGVPVFHSTRGGGATYHDFGQLVLYPHLNLRKRGMNIQEYIKRLEQWGIDACHTCGVHVFRGVQPGLWMHAENDESMSYENMNEARVNDEKAKDARMKYVCARDEKMKVAFIGLAMKDGYSQHGISFNLSQCNLANFKKIIACNSFEAIGCLPLEFEKLAQALVDKNPFGLDIEMVE